MVESGSGSKRREKESQAHRPSRAVPAPHANAELVESIQLQVGAGMVSSTESYNRVREAHSGVGLGFGAAESAAVDRQNNIGQVFNRLRQRGACLPHDGDGHGDGDGQRWWG